MRKILFRGKRISNGEWVEGGIMRAFHPNFDSTARGFAKQEPNCYCICENQKVFFVEQKSIGQYTGLQDKNGKRIFEGDVIQMNDNPKDLAVIRFGEFSCVDIELEAKTDRVHGWYYKPLHTDDLSKLEPFCWEIQLNEMWVEQCGIEVIGNIHDNKEFQKLLE